MRKLNNYSVKNVDFSRLYDSIIREEGAYQNYITFLREMGSCQTSRKNLAARERLSNGNLSAFYAFKVNDDIDDELLKDFINYAFSEYYKKHDDYLDNLNGTYTLSATLTLYKSLLKKGNVVQFRLDSPTDYYNQDGTYKFIDIKNALNVRTNYYFYIFISELVKAGVLEPYTKTLSGHLIYSGTDKNIDDLTYATNLSKKGFTKVGQNPVDFGFDPEKFTSNPLNIVPRIISYIDQEPVRSFNNPIPQKKGEVRKTYKYPGTGLLTITDFMQDDDFKPTAISDISYATRFLFMARSAAENYWISHSGLGFDPQYLYSPEEGVYHGVNKGWIEHAVNLAIKYKEYGEPYNLVKVIQFIKATKNENLSNYPVLTFSNYEFGDAAASMYYGALKEAYKDNPEIVNEILFSQMLKLHQSPIKNVPDEESSESGNHQPGEE